MAAVVAAATAVVVVADAVTRLLKSDTLRVVLLETHTCTGVLITPVHVFAPRSMARRLTEPIRLPTLHLQRDRYRRSPSILAD